MDWTETETTRFADVVLPGSTYLEANGTRCNFEGRLVEYSRAVRPAAGLSGTEVLRGLARQLGVETGDDTTVELQGIMETELGDLKSFYWNRGEERVHEKAMRLVPVEAGVRTSAIPVPITHSERYKREIREVGTDRFRVRF
jgi:predicted molibdopterin-dependent oxidoreductase YjgC